MVVNRRDKYMICRNGGLIGAITNGGLAEYAAVPENYLDIKIALFNIQCL